MNNGSELGRIVRGFFQEAINGHDLQALDAYCSPDYRWNGSDHSADALSDLHGLGAFKRLVGEFFVAFPDFHTDILDEIVGKDRVVVRYEEGGTHASDFLGVPASGKKVIWPGIGIYRIENGLIAEEWFQSALIDRMRAAAGIPGD